ncbi:MAG: DUF2911 domain-containing protein [Acidobacteria bacterium]|nr:DUF2911 domain-containing protein [Acidobacteriota bacterium]
MRVMTQRLMVMALLTAGPVSAQSIPDVKLPASPAGQASVQVAGRWETTAQGGRRYVDGQWIHVTYGRPLLRGRTGIFGSGAEYGKAIADGAPVWRAGANDTTRLTTQVPLRLGGKTLPPGTYNVFVDLKAGVWTLVLTNQPVQAKYDPNDKVNLYGAYNYDPRFELVRVPMTVQDNDLSFEQFTIAFVNTTPTATTLAMWWDRTRATVALPVATP